MALVGVVGAALVRDVPGRGSSVLASRRTEPPALAGLWEFPGGKVGERLGGDLPIGSTAVLRVYLCRLLSGEPQLVDHDEHRWLSADELGDVPWIPVDLPLVEALRTLLD